MAKKSKAPKIVATLGLSTIAPVVYDGVITEVREAEQLIVLEKKKKKARIKYNTYLIPFSDVIAVKVMNAKVSSIKSAEGKECEVTIAPNATVIVKSKGKIFKDTTLGKDMLAVVSDKGTLFVLKAGSCLEGEEILKEDEENNGKKSGKKSGKKDGKKDGKKSGKKSSKKSKNDDDDDDDFGSDDSGDDDDDFNDDDSGDDSGDDDDFNDDDSGDDDDDDDDDFGSDDDDDDDF